MDIFGRKKIASLEYDNKCMTERLIDLTNQVAELRKPIEGHKNRYRTFVVSLRDNTEFQVKCRRFSRDNNGYNFYEVDQRTYIGVSLSTFDGYQVGHIATDKVWKVFEKEEVDE